MAVYREAMTWTAELNEMTTHLEEGATGTAIPVLDKENNEAIKLVKMLTEAYCYDRSVKNSKHLIEVTLQFTFIDEFDTGEDVPCTIKYIQLREPQPWVSIDNPKSLPMLGFITIDCEKWFPTRSQLRDEWMQ